MMVGFASHYPSFSSVVQPHFIDDAPDCAAGSPRAIRAGMAGYELAVVERRQLRLPIDEPNARISWAASSCTNSFRSRIKNRRLIALPIGPILTRPLAQATEAVEVGGARSGLGRIVNHHLVENGAIRPDRFTQRGDQSGRAPGDRPEGAHRRVNEQDCSLLRWPHADPVQRVNDRVAGQSFHRHDPIVMATSKI